MKKDIIKGEIMKKNKIFVLGLIVTFVAFISLSLVSSTWAKYTSSVSGTSTAKVAKWSFTGLNLSEENEIVFDLFDTILDTDDKAEADVKEGLIAPGTKGNAEFSFQNTGEVTADAIITLELQGSTDIPLIFSFGNDETGYETLTFAQNKSTTDIKIRLNIGGAAIQKNLKWEWKYYDEENDNDKKDTELGETAPEILVKLTVKFVQVD